MKQVIVGTFPIGDVSCQLVLREGNGGEFYCRPGDIPYPRMKIGADVDNWYSVVSTLLHESQEFVLSSLCLRYTPDDEFGRDAASYVFWMRHEQFSDVCARAGIFMSAYLPQVATAWKKWKKAKLKDA